MVYFVIVGTRDDPLYELEFGTSRGGGDGLNKVFYTCRRKIESSYLDSRRVQTLSSIYRAFISGCSRRPAVHFNRNVSNLILVCTANTDSRYLKSIDKFNDWIISAYIAPSNTKFVILHDTKNDDGIKNFFHEVQELFVKTIMNPFYEPNSPITSATFDTRIRAAAKRYL